MIRNSRFFNFGANHLFDAYLKIMSHLIACSRFCNFQKMIVFKVEYSKAAHLRIRSHYCATAFVGASSAALPNAAYAFERTRTLRRILSFAHAGQKGVAWREALWGSSGSGVLRRSVESFSGCMPVLGTKFGAQQEGGLVAMFPQRLPFRSPPARP